jgi:GNAT superfamily N-acetyltransferase
MIADLQLRRAVPTDVNELARLRALMDIEDGVSEPTEFRAKFADWFERHGHKFIVFVAELTDRLVGTVWLERIERVPRPGEVDPAAIGYVTFAFVEKPYRNQGIGAAMLEQLHAAAHADRYEVLIVWPSDRSVPLYRRNDFAPPNELLEYRQSGSKSVDV